MQSFNRKTKIDLPQIEKKQLPRAGERESDAFDLLFKNNKKEADLIDLKKGKRHKGYQKYLGILIVLFIPACFFIVQIVTGGNEIDRYKSITETANNEESNNIKTVNNDVVEEDIPDVQFASSSPLKAQTPRNENKQAVVVNKKLEIHRAIAIVKSPPKPVVKPVRKSVPVVVSNIRKNIPVKKIQAPKISTPVVVVSSAVKVDQAIADIMLRPLSVVSNPEQKQAESTLRGVH